MEFINRVNEFVTLQKEISENDIIFFYAKGGHGTTSFLQEFKRKSDGAEVVLAYLNSSHTLSMSILEQIFRHPQIKKTLQKYADKILGSKNGSAIASILEGIPYAGTFLSHLAMPKSAPSVYLGNYADALVELLLPVFREIASKDRVIILIDSAQYITESDFALLANISAVRNVSTVLAFIENSENHIKAYNYLSLRANLAIGRMYFGAPEPKMIKEIADALSILLTDVQIEQLVISTKLNLHQIMFSIQQGNIKSSLSVLESAIIILLHICSFGLNHEMLVNLISRSNIFSNDLDKDIINALSSLVDNQLIFTDNSSEQNIVFYLPVVSNPLIADCVSNYANTLYYENLVYTYYTNLSTLDKRQGYIVELLYRLAQKSARIETSIFALDLIESKLWEGTAIAPDVIESAQFDKRRIRDMRLAIIYYCRERDYQIALKWLWQYLKKKSDLDILLPYLLDRNRKLVEAEKSFTEQIGKQNNPELKCLLIACSIANTIHLSGEKAANDRYAYEYQSLKGIKNHGYIARNLGSTVSFEKKKEYYETAITNFSLYGDDFGYYSTLCNYGSAICINREPNKGLLKLHEAADGLQQFGHAHLHVVYNDLGIGYTLAMNYSEGIKYFTLAEKLGQNTMPILAAKINLACCTALMGGISEAYRIMLNIQNQIEQHPVRNLKIKYYSNILFIEYLKNIRGLASYLLNHFEEVNEYVDVDLINKYNKLINNGITLTHEESRALYYPGNLAYWYINPLKLIA